MRLDITCADSREWLRSLPANSAKRRAKDKGLILPGGGTGRQASIWEAET